MKMIRCTPCVSMDDIERLMRYIRPFLNHGNQYYRDAKLVISTFAGQESKFGHHTFEHGWIHIKKRLEEITPVGSCCFWCGAAVDFQAALDFLHPVFLHQSHDIPFAPLHGWIFQRTFPRYRDSA